jgi:hypothetical protein
MVNDTTHLRPSEIAAAECDRFFQVYNADPRYRFNVKMSCGAGAVTVSLVTDFTPGDAAEYREVESRALALLACISRTKPGSVWGSTSDGVGGHVALTSGKFVINKSGCRKLTCAAIARSLNIRIAGA